MRKRFMLFTFAVAALAGYCADSHDEAVLGFSRFEDLAAAAYKQAEAMLKEWELNQRGECHANTGNRRRRESS